MSRNVLQSHEERIEKPLDISLGGTGQKSASLALAALGGVPTTAIGTINGPVPLNSNNKIPDANLPVIQPSNINEYSIIVPSHFPIGMTSNLIITDEDINKPLVITTSIGTIEVPRGNYEYDDTDNPASLLVGIAIPFDANIVGQICNIVINGDHINVPIIAPEFIFDTPILDVTAGNVQVTSNININGSPPTVANGGIPANANVKLKIELSETSDFANIVNTFINDVVTYTSNFLHNSYHIVTNLISLNGNIHYYARQRLEYIYHDRNGVNPDVLYYTTIWSLFNFTTIQAYPTQLWDRVTDNNTEYANSRFALGDYALNMSYDGRTLAVPSQYYLGPGVQVTDTPGTPFSMFNNSFNFNTSNNEIYAPFNPLGISVAVSGNGNYVFAMIQNTTSSYLDMVRYHRPINNTPMEWSGSPIYYGANNVGFYGAPMAMCTNLDGSVLCFKQNTPSHQSNGHDVLNAMFFTLDSNGDITNITTQYILPSQIDTEILNDEFGRALAINSDGTILVVGSTTTQFNGELAGAAYVLTRTLPDGLFALEQMLVPTDRLASNMRVGEDVSISHDGTTIAVSEVVNITDASVMNGYVRIYKKQGNTWVEDGVVTYPYPNLTLTSGFGWSIKLNANGNVLVVGAPYTQRVGNGENATIDQVGGVYLFVRSSNGVWSLVSELYDTVDIPDAEVGRCVNLTNDGSVVLATSSKPYADPGNMYNTSTTRNVLVFT